MPLISDTQYLFIRSFKKLLRNPILLFFSLFQPIIFLLLFTQLFSRFAQVPGFPAESYLLFATPGIVLQNSFASAFQSGISMVDDLKSGYLEKMLVTQVSRPAIFLGRIEVDIVRTIIQSLIIFMLAFMMGASPITGVPGLLLMLLTISLFGVAWSGISIFLGLKTKNAETVFGIGGFLTFPLLFMSTALTPANFMPDWMQIVSQLNPISYTVDALRVVMLTGFDLGIIFTAFAVVGSIGVLTLGAAIYQFRKIIG
jgi:ABC-2 type transport system permease protein